MSLQEIDETIWNDVIGQRDVVARLDRAAADPVHAYLFLGQPGVGTIRAARAFAGLILSSHLAGEPAERARRLALSGSHPDLIDIRPEGAALRVEEAQIIIRQAQTSATEGPRKVIVVHGVDIIQEAAIGRLLKIIEEPPPSTVFVLLASNVQPEIVTIASRCVVVEFAPIPVSMLEVALMAEGADFARIKLAARAAGGDLDRARLLATDDQLAVRAGLWAAVPDKLDGTGGQAAELVNQIRDAMDEAQNPLDARHQSEIEALDRRAEELGERGSGRSEVVAQHKREIRLQRNDELRFGLATLARHYRDRLREAGDPATLQALAAIQRSAEALTRNPNEALLLQALFLELDR